MESNSKLIAIQQCDSRGWTMTPCNARSKEPFRPNWQNERLNLEEITNIIADDPSLNIGVVLGRVSEGLVCVDLGNPIAIELAHQFLPQTGLVVRDKQNQRTQWLYRVPSGIKSTRFNLPVEPHNKSNKLAVVEVLGDGNHVLVGSSVHPNGDVYDILEGEPATVDGAKLLEVAKSLFNAVLDRLGLIPEEKPKTNRNGISQNAGGDTTPKNSGKIEVVSPSLLSPLELFRPFPVETLPKLVGEVVHRVSKAMGCDPSFVAVPALAVLAGAIGNSRRIQLKQGWTEPAIVWTGIVGESGTLKSPPLEWLTQTLRDREETALERHAAAMEDFEAEKMRHDAAVTEWKRKKSSEPPPRSQVMPTAERRLTSDATIESVCLMLADNPHGMILVRDELAGWVSAFDQYKSQGGSDAAHWLSIHSAKGFAVDRKTGDRRTLFVPRPAMSVTGGIQPATLRSVLAAGHIESGLAARLLFTYPPRQAKRWSEAEISPDLEATYKRLIDGLFALEPQIEEDGKPKPLILGLSPAAKSDWVTFYNEHAAEQADLSGELAAAWSKLECYAARLALVVHCVRVVNHDPSLTSPDVIDESSIGAGVVLSRWFGHEAKRVYSMLAETEGERELRQLVEWITTRGGTASARELQRGPRRFRNATAGYAESELNKIVKSGQGVWEPIETTPAGGAPSRQVRLCVGGDWRHNPKNSAENQGCVAGNSVEAVA